jgi:uridine kinase
MRGDILIIGEQHREAAEDILNMIFHDIQSKTGKFIITISGESGAGKSELSCALEDVLERSGIITRIIQQDDYFSYPPKTNERMREADIGRVGPGEVRLDLLNENLESILRGNNEIVKPLVIFEDDMITSETIDISPFKVIIIDGTYTTMLKHVDCHIFIDRDREDTRADRLKRNREKQNEHLEKILDIEHRIISAHKSLANIIVDRNFKVFKS